MTCLLVCAGSKAKPSCVVASTHASARLCIINRLEVCSDDGKANNYGCACWQGHGLFTGLTVNKFCHTMTLSHYLQCLVRQS